MPVFIYIIAHFFDECRYFLPWGWLMICPLYHYRVASVITGAGIDFMNSYSMKSLNSRWTEAKFNSSFNFSYKSDDLIKLKQSISCFNLRFMLWITE